MCIKPIPPREIETHIVQVDSAEMIARLVAEAFEKVDRADQIADGGLAPLVSEVGRWSRITRNAADAEAAVSER